MDGAVGTRILAISFTNNLTGKQLERDRFDALVGLSRRHSTRLLSDEVYCLKERDLARLPQAAGA